MRQAEPDQGQLVIEAVACTCSNCGHQFEAVPEATHRVLCGDATDADNVSRLFAERERADVCITDPPYSVNYDRSHESRGGDAAVHASYHEADLDPTAILCFMAVVPADTMVWTYPIDRHLVALAAAYVAHGWELRKELVWVKDTFSFWPGAKYQQRHEPIMIAARKGRPVNGDVPANESTVREVARPKAHDLHPTMKPIELWEPFVRFHSSDGGIVYDPFLGSGTTLICSARLGRRCRGLELSPNCVDMIRHRYTEWAKDAGLDAGEGALE